MKHPGIVVDVVVVLVVVVVVVVVDVVVWQGSMAGVSEAVDCSYPTFVTSL